MKHPVSKLQALVPAAISRYGRTAPKVLPLRTLLANGLLADGLDVEGFAQFDALVADCRADFGPRHETTLVLANNRAMKLAERSRPEGLTQLAELVPIVTEQWGATDRRTLLLRSNLAAATGMMGRFEDAITQIEALLAEGDALDEELIETLQTNLVSWRLRNGS